MMSKAREIAGLNGGLRNLALNGNFTISQRGDFNTATAFTSESYFVDRWRSGISGVTATRQRVLNGFDRGLHSIKVVATSSATGALGVSQRWNETELPMAYSDAQGDYLVISGWMRSNSSNAKWYIYNGTARDTQTHSGSGQWEYMVSKVPTSWLDGTFDFNAFLFNPVDVSYVPITTGDYLEIAMVQIEVNSSGVPTPFEHRSYGQELALCQRYYEKFTPDTVDGVVTVCQAYNAANAQGAIRFAEKRAAPTVSYSGSINLRNSGGSSGSASAISMASGLSSCQLYFSRDASGLTAGYASVLRVSPGGYFTIDAEL